MIKLIVSIAVCLLGGAAGSFFTSGSIDSWYIYLKKPALNPPSWVFAPVWTALYIMMGVSVYLVWRKGLGDRYAGSAIIAFLIQLILNFLWSPVFFGMRSPLYSFIIIILMWIAILATIILFYRISKVSAYLLVPYLLWVSFAIYLNGAILYLNGARL